jgi:uncharacterized membrane protein YkoI
LAQLWMLPWIASASGDDKSAKRRGATQQDQVLEAVKRGEIRPFAEIQAAAEMVMPGQVVGVEIERRKGRLVYEFKIIAAGGRVREVYVDAATLDIVKIE